MSEATTLKYVEYENHSSGHPHLEIVDAQPERPPKLTAEEADYLLKRGPYVARLRAAEKVLSITMLYAGDELTGGFIQESNIAQLQENVTLRRAALSAYEKGDIDQEIPGIGALHISLHPMETPQLRSVHDKDILNTLGVIDSGLLERVMHRSLIDRQEGIDVRAGRRKYSDDGSIIDATNWTAFRECRSEHPDERFVQGAEQNKAKLICQSCLVKTECLGEAIDNLIEWGVWGGMTERERRAMLKKRSEVS